MLSRNTLRWRLAPPLPRPLPPLPRPDIFEESLGLRENRRLETGGRFKGSCARAAKNTVLLQRRGCSGTRQAKTLFSCSGTIT
eukprot:6173405-Pleurochrysis_carterae.AAC.3